MDAAGEKEEAGVCRIGRAAKAALGFLLVVTASACMVESDGTADFHFNLKVLDGNGKPVQGAVVFFVDRSRQQTAEARRIARKVGTTNTDGELDTTFRYHWGYRYFTVGRGDNVSHDVPYRLIVRKEGYNDGVIDFLESELRPTSRGGQLEKTLTLRSST
jgi:hypothetical protein